MSTLYAYRDTPDLQRAYLTTNRIIGCQIAEAPAWADRSEEMMTLCIVYMVRDDGTTFPDSPEFSSRGAALAWLRGQCRIQLDVLPVLNSAGGVTGE
jgi:hypothetical protein